MSIRPSVACLSGCSLLDAFNSNVVVFNACECCYGDVIVMKLRIKFSTKTCISDFRILKLKE